jgi:L-fuconolactonase
LDPGAPDAAETIARLGEQTGALGLRFILGGGIDYASIDELDWLWREIDVRRWALMVAPRGRFADVAQIARRYPDIRITIDHLGARAHQKDDAAFADHKALLALAMYPNIAVKASGLPDYSTHPFPYTNIHGFVRSAFDAFGAGRFFFGSDLTRLACGYGALLALFTQSFGWLGGHAREAVMGPALLRWLRWQ